jgi:DNA polymerase-3 subunit beta
VGKRSGNGFIAHKAILVNALSQALSDRVTLLDFTIGRRGLLGYLKSLGGSNIVKVIPSSDSASGSQANGHKRLKVSCGANTSYLTDSEWIGDNTPMTFCEVRVSPSNIVKPNIGSIELSEALSRVLPFVSREDNRPVLQCVLFTAKEGKLTLVSADGFRLSVVSLDYDDTEGQALIHLDDLKGIANALKSAKRARISFEGEDVSKTSSLIIDTELIRYKWLSTGGQYPEYDKLIPSEFNTIAHLDTVEAVKAISSLKALANSKSYPIDLSLNGGIVMSNPDDKGEVSMPADIEGGEVKVRIDGSYLSEALKACGGMVDFKLTDGKSPVLFTVDGYKLVVMPMITSESQKPEDKGEAQAKPEASPAEAKEPVKPKANKPKPRVKEPVAAK